MYTRKANISLVNVLFLFMILLSNYFIIRAQHSESRPCTTSDQRAGVCVMANNCEWWVKKMRNQQFPTGSDRCGFADRDVIVCCPVQQSIGGTVILPNNGDYSEGATCRMETDSGPGVCMAIYKCEFRIDHVRQGKRFDTAKGRCSFEGNIEIVCCPLNKQLEPSVPQATWRPAERACQQYQAMVAGYSGYEINKHIIGGENAKSGEFPFMVSLGYQNDENDRSIISYMCGGSLITDRHVLTAAHCILNTNNYRLIEIRLGSISLQDNSRDVQRISIDDIITHPRYRISRNYFDIAIITMRRPIILSNLTMPICLQTYSIPAFKSYLNSEMIATGWGVTNYNDDSPSLNLKKTRKLSLIDSQTCGEQYRASNRIPNGVDDSLLCILDENPVDRSDVCQGDSGGPLFLKSTVVSSLLGIVSFGQGCASSVPGIYTSVYYYLDWIERIVWPAQ